jgi:hypothetical protein
MLTCGLKRYLDGIDILYGTNTFHFSDWSLIQNLPRLLPQQHLSNVTSLQMLWKFNDDDVPWISMDRSGSALKPLWDDPTRQDNPLQRLCSMIPKSFPSLRNLYISLQTSISPPGTAVEEVEGRAAKVESVILRPMEEMLRSLGPGPRKEFSVAIQRKEWMFLLLTCQKIYGSRLRVEEDQTLGRWGRFWKPLASADFSNAETGSDKEHKLGYWICSGWNDGAVSWYYRTFATS